jgi:hypothetical protein
MYGLIGASSPRNKNRLREKNVARRSCIGRILIETKCSQGYILRTGLRRISEMPRRQAKGLVALAPADGSVVLADERYERYAHQRALMKSKLDAYRAAGFASVSDQAASSNASKLEREVPAIVARIAYMARDMDGLRQEKRKRLEERLWLYHDGNVADYWETVDVEVRNKKGDVVLKADGTPKTKQIKRMKDLSQLTPEQQQHGDSGSTTTFPLNI